MPPALQQKSSATGCRALRWRPERESGIWVHHVVGRIRRAGPVGLAETVEDLAALARPAEAEHVVNGGASPHVASLTVTVAHPGDVPRGGQLAPPVADEQPRSA